MMPTETFYNKAIDQNDLLFFLNKHSKNFQGDLEEGTIIELGLHLDNGDRIYIFFKVQIDSKIGKVLTMISVATQNTSIQMEVMNVKNSVSYCCISNQESIDSIKKICQ